jgi:hypothetical protein
MTRSDFLIVLGVPGGGPTYSLEPSEGKVAAIKEATKYEGEMSGFTLFEVKDGWQMSIRPAAELGWIVQTIPAPMAQRILAALETDPRFVEAGQTIRNSIATAKMDALLAANKAAREAFTAALRAWSV